MISAALRSPVFVVTKPAWSLNLKLFVNVTEESALSQCYYPRVRHYTLVFAKKKK